MFALINLSISFMLPMYIIFYVTYVYCFFKNQPYCPWVIFVLAQSACPELTDRTTLAGYSVSLVKLIMRQYKKASIVC